VFGDERLVSGIEKPSVQNTDGFPSVPWPVGGSVLGPAVFSIDVLEFLQQLSVIRGHFFIALAQQSLFAPLPIICKNLADHGALIHPRFGGQLFYVAAQLLWDRYGELSSRCHSRIARLGL
jgi:hypothetical protein